MEPPTCTCGSTFFDSEGGYGMDFCIRCGLGQRAGLRTEYQFVYQDRIPGQQSYTRLKRFKKYLCRAMRQQSAATVPQETWDYLWRRRPYRNARHVQTTLKQARHLKRKCYDSLPFLTAALCPHLQVPVITEQEKNFAIRLFSRIDAAVRTGPFVSYLFCLEYILKKLGRHDVVPHINRIQCTKRREAYQVRLDAIFAMPEDTTVLPIPWAGTKFGGNIMNQLRKHV
jgi:hypothetical protein